MIAPMRKNLLIVLLPLLIVGAACTYAPDHLPVQPVAIVTKTGPYRLDAEIPATDAQMERGLMFRTSVPDHTGMLFDFHTPQSFAMWMKNTLVPLDMVFIGADGVITQIEANAEPRSLRRIPTVTPDRAVLELAGGTAARYHITVGDRVTAPGWK